jgi:2-polyprenyl-3-methyl-5-hydroxy-6-metoxy-1,4-benzoquinol methylase
MAETVSYASPSGRIAYRDSRDHFENGLLRLLHLDQRAFETWLALADEARAGSGDLLDALGRSYRAMTALAGGEPAFPPSVEEGPGGEPGSLWQPRIAESPAFGVARSVDGRLGWLVRPSAGGWVREREPPAYEEAYFEGDPLRAGGYGDYAAQGDWRLEKARRQVGEIRQAAGLSAGARALDVGSGYGFFRKALDEAGVAHDGLEISAHARATARRLYGFETAAGTLSEHRDEWRDRYDLITLWDMLEHVPSPRDFLGVIATCLRPGGVLAIKTPNLDCPEAEIFGPHYHSLKREHLVYFTAGGLQAAAGEQGLAPVQVSSISHLLLGFVGAAQTAAWASALRGADLVAYFRKR